MRETTCEMCPHRVSHHFRMGKHDEGVIVWGCGQVDRTPIIPGSYSRGEPPVFVRVPMWCPRPDAEVEKRPEPTER